MLANCCSLKTTPAFLDYIYSIGHNRNYRGKAPRFWVFLCLSSLYPWEVGGMQARQTQLTAERERAMALPQNAPHKQAFFLVRV